METVTDFTFLHPKIIADGDIKKCLLLGRKAMTNPDSILKSRYITLLTKVYIVKAMVFPVVVCGCESWAIKKTEIMAFDPITSWQIDGETMETVTDLIILRSKITAAMKLKDACS